MSAGRILLIQLRQLGDTLMSTPLIRQLPRLYPGAEIDVLCENANACILQNNPQVSGIEKLPRGASVPYFLRLAARLRRRRYDIVIDAQSLVKTAMLAWMTGARRRIGFHRRGRHRLYTHPFQVTTMEYAAVHKLRMLQHDGVDLEDVAIDFPVDQRSKLEAATFCKRYFCPPVAAIYGVSRHASRIWPAAKFAEIGDRLARCGFQPYLVHGPGEEQAARSVSKLMRHPALIDCPTLSFPALKEVIASCALMVANDGGPKHLAVAARTPCVTLYENGFEAAGWNPPRRPDTRVVVTRRRAKPQTVEGTFTDADVLADIKVDAVWAEIQLLIERGYVVLRDHVGHREDDHQRDRCA
jgi:ADP-heptose:LPS heptosyltransferase